MQGIRLDGQSVYLTEVAEEYFPYIITWRNDPENNRYLNQPFRLTMDKQCAWYEQYRNDPTQGLLVIVDKKQNIPFATMGWIDYDREQRLCITGRLLVGDRRYRGSLLFVEATVLFADYMYGTFGIDTCRGLGCSTSRCVGSTWIMMEPKFMSDSLNRSCIISWKEVFTW